MGVDWTLILQEWSGWRFGRAVLSLQRWGRWNKTDTEHERQRDTRRLFQKAGLKYSPMSNSELSTEFLRAGVKC